ncbi:MAG TPA: TraB/GumN family protein, partial [Chitinophagaceae bacterium]
AAIFEATTRMSLSLLSRAKPIMLMSMVYPSLLGCNPEGWETRFMQMAGEKQMEVLGLEKVEDQISVLDSIPYSVQAEMFMKTMYNLDSTKASFSKMMEVYQKQDIEEMNHMTSTDEDFGEYEEVMLRKRNRNWIHVMREAMKVQPTFFAVGAGHLGGTDGVISLLRKEGYSVTAVRY